MVFKTVDLDIPEKKHQGKVRDFYNINSQRILITTDRISAFDRVLGYIPHKGQVLNQLSQFWFEKTKDIVENHLIEVIHPNVMVVHEANPYAVEMVVRGYISGVTSTSLWKNYEKGERIIYGLRFPDGLKKNQKLASSVITPTTKAEKGRHDARLTETEIFKKKLISPQTWKKMVKTSLALFERGTKICAKNGIILVDTKYEFADYKGSLMLIDEIHTPDSSRFWKKDTYRQRFAKGQEPENFDKEFFRIWYAKKGYLGNGPPPEMSRDLMIKTSLRYIRIYEMITEKKFIPEIYPLERKIIRTVKDYIGRKS
ncbi:phosphoribosylaminoimidazolesuccinocarboxamide synthase [Candidatus Gottesmanbacteria bacterium RBG_16_37_8]|uniref:Phosphoribosylaminoimidazole-succinocarboxamide synthase n=1 Tax=Candidatus Gottesmanbacteria bacterium RBG_16_37_8 TaxID=1798371 RepID=A0A1F5YWP9_9BACT|nr:MAG: phosphoribosylaminoimidazolesuccinocarboxamide synthase [Candidatus Gottesmanbacteria bacterium RBG_16_37_8]